MTRSVAGGGATASLNSSRTSQVNSSDVIHGNGKLSLLYQFLSPSFLQRQHHTVTTVLKTVAVTPGKDETLLSLLTRFPLAHVAMSLADALPQACEILGQAFFSLVEFFLPPVTTASDEQLKLIIQKFARVGYNTVSPLLPLPKHCSLYWGGRLIKSCQSLEDACN